MKFTKRLSTAWPGADGRSGGPRFRVRLFPFDRVRRMRRLPPKWAAKLTKQVKPESRSIRFDLFRGRSGTRVSDIAVDRCVKNNAKPNASGMQKGGIHQQRLRQGGC